MVVLVEHRDGLVSRGHLFNRVVRIEWRPAGEHRARDRQQAIADTAQSAAVAVTAFAQFGVAMSAALVMLRGDARPVIDSARSHIWQAWRLTTMQYLPLRLVTGATPDKVRKA
jgi:hypothetical protein